MQLNPCLFFKGNAEEALEHYRAALGGEVDIIRFEGTPAADAARPEWNHKVLYGSLRSPVGVVACMDAPPGRGGDAGDNFSIAIQTDTVAQTDTIFSKLSAGGTIMMPLEKTFWSQKFGMFTDKFGVKWMVSVNG
jgi:PhnB protein